MYPVPPGLRYLILHTPSSQTKDLSICNSPGASTVAVKATNPEGDITSANRVPSGALITPVSLIALTKKPIDTVLLPSEPGPTGRSKPYRSAGIGSQELRTVIITAQIRRIVSLMFMICSIIRWFRIS